MFIGFNLAFLPMHASGLLGMPRRVHTYPDDPGWALLNGVSSAGAFVLAGGVMLCFGDLLCTLRRPRRAHGDPHGAATLEWVPSEAYGLRSIPQVESVRPLWDRPALADEIQAGAHWLPGNPTGLRETLVSRARDARPLYLMVLPGDGWLPLVAAAGTAGFFLLLTVAWTVCAWACGLLAVGCIWAWLWKLDRPAPVAVAAIGRALTLPVGGARHAVWALCLMLTVDGTIFLSLLYAHLHVAMAAAECPPPGAALPPLGAALSALLPWPLALWAAQSASRRVQANAPRRGTRRAVLGSTALASVAVGSMLWLHLHSGLAPRQDAWSATVVALLAYSMLHGMCLLLFAAFVWARSRAGLLHAQHRVALDAMRALLLVSALQALLAVTTVHGLPTWI